MTYSERLEIAMEMQMIIPANSEMISGMVIDPVKPSNPIHGSERL